MTTGFAKMWYVENNNTNISMLIDKIIILETDNIGEYNRPKLDIEVVWNTPYLNVEIT